MIHYLIKNTTVSSKLIQRSIQKRVFTLSCRTCQEKQENNEGKSFLQASFPKPAIYLGFGGAIPFVSLAMASTVACDPYIHWISTAQVGYAACILTFLGGVHWGKELMVNKDNPCLKTLTISVIPSLYAWSAFALPPSIAMYYLSAGLTGAAFYDINQSAFPGWYRKLRIPLTLMAATSVAITGYNVG